MSKKSSKQKIEEAENGVDDVDENDEMDVLELTEEQLEAILEAYGGVEDLEPAEKIDRTLFESRNIYLNGEINSDSCEHVVAMIHYYNQEDKHKNDDEKAPINVFIASEGGEAYKGYNVVSAIERSKVPVYTYSEGTQLMSMGFIIFLAGDKRFMSRHSNPMYHQLSAGTQGTNLTMSSEVEYFRRMQKETAQYIVERTEIPLEKLEYYDERNLDWHLTFDECKKYKVFTDEI